MTKITFAPIEELVVHDTFEMDRDDLYRERITPGGNLPLFWCDGILYSFSPLPLSDEMVKEYLKGRIHWGEVHYAKMQDYQPIVSLEAEEYKSTMNIRVLSTGRSQLHKDFIKWLKTKK